MNKAARKALEAYQEENKSALSYRQQITCNTILQALCYHSSHISKQDILYASVNGIDLREDGTYCLLIFSDAARTSQGEDSSSGLYDHFLSYELIREKVESVLYGHYIYHYAHIDDEVVFLLSFPHSLGFEPQLFWDHLHHDLHRIQKDALRQYDLPISIYHSEIIRGIAPISQAFEYLMNLLHLHQFLLRDQDMDIHLPFVAETSLPLPLQLQTSAEALARAIGEKKDLTEALAHIFRLFETAALHSVEELKIHYAHFITSQLPIYLQEQGIASVYDNPHEILSPTLDTAANWMQLREWLTEYTALLAQNHQKKSGLTHYEQICLIREYIDRSFADPNLCVAFLTEAFSIKQSVLSNAFKKTFGISVSEYILQKRLKEACHLLETTEDTIEQISNVCGFGSTETFFRQFKKDKKATPSFYRRCFAQKEEQV